MGQQSRVASPATAKISPRHSIGVNGRQTGTGKSWLACAFGRQAARLGHSVLYVRVPRMFEDLALARLDGSFPRIIDKLIRDQIVHNTHRIALQGESMRKQKATPLLTGAANSEINHS